MVSCLSANKMRFFMASSVCSCKNLVGGFAVGFVCGGDQYSFCRWWHVCEQIRWFLHSFFLQLQEFSRWVCSWICLWWLRVWVACELSKDVQIPPPGNQKSWPNKEQHIYFWCAAMAIAEQCLYGTYNTCGQLELWQSELSNRLECLSVFGRVPYQ